MNHFISYFQKVFLSILLLVSINVHSQSKFKKTFSTTGNAYKLLNTIDGGLLSIGSSRLIKTDKNGNTEWSTLLEYSTSAQTYSAAQNTTGDYFILMSIIENSFVQIIVTKVNDTGSFVQAKKLFYSGSNTAWDIVSDDTGGVIFIGGGCSGSSYAIRSDKDLNFLWQKSYNILNNGTAQTIIRNSSGNFIIGGSEYVGVTERPQILFEIDINGNVIWHKAYEGFETAQINTIVELKGGGYVFAGLGKIINNQGTDMVITRVDNLGNIIWSRILSDPNGWEGIKSAVQLVDGSILFSGNSQYTGNSDALLGKIDLNGTILFLKNIPAENYNGVTYDDITSLITVCDNKIASLGTIDGISLAFIDGNGDGYCNGTAISNSFFNVTDTVFSEITSTITKSDLVFANSAITFTTTSNFSIDKEYCNYTDPSVTPCLSTSISANGSLAKELSIYPNPTSHQLTIINNSLVINEINIIDLTGKMIKTTKQNTNTINVADLPSGIYFIELITNNKIITKKFVKQ